MLFGHKTKTMNEKLKAFALNRQIQILVVFGVLAGIGYYVYLKRRKDKESAF